MNHHVPTAPGRSISSPIDTQWDDAELTSPLDSSENPFGDGSHFPARFGNFRLLRPVGSGGMGCVFAAWDETLERTVALKIISPRVARYPVLAERMRTEARAAARLSHPAIANVYSLGEAQGLPFIAMEFLTGQDLSQRIRATGPMEPREALRLILTAAEGLAYAASRHVIHRDIKPANLFLCEDGTLKIMDFGLAKRLDLDSGLTQSGTLVGTPAYMAPEQAYGGPADARSDMYSLGCTFFSLLAGHAPYARQTPLKVLYHHANTPLPIPSTWETVADGGLVRLLKKLTAKDPDERYAEWSEAVADLRVLLPALKEPALPLPQTPIPRPRRSPWFPRLAATFVLAALAGGAWAVLGKPAPAPLPPAAPQTVTVSAPTHPEEDLSQATVEDIQRGAQILWDAGLPAPPALLAQTALNSARETQDTIGAWAAANSPESSTHREQFQAFVREKEPGLNPRQKVRLLSYAAILFPEDSKTLAQRWEPELSAAGDASPRARLRDRLPGENRTRQ
ncbi:MAG: serine/threonine-protein kinase [Sumerlaeia bacterium]